MWRKQYEAWMCALVLRCGPVTRATLPVMSRLAYAEADDDIVGAAVRRGEQ